MMEQATKGQQIIYSSTKLYGQVVYIIEAQKHLDVWEDPESQRPLQMFTPDIF